MTTNSVNLARVRLSLPMGIGIVLSIGFGYFLLQIVDDASRSIGWIVFSGVIALMLYPALNFLNPFLPRIFAVFALVIFVIILITLPAYTVVDNVNRQTRKLERSLPARAAQLETNGRFAKGFSEFQLESKTRMFIKSIPETLQGGTREEQLRANADRTIAFIAGGVLMLFFLLYGHKLVDGAVSIIPEHKQRLEIKRLLYRAYARTTIFGWAQICLSITAALTTYGVCRLAHIPAAGLFGVWVGMWNLIPVFGVVIGTLPVVLLAGANNLKTAIFILLFFVIYEVIESFARYKLLGSHALRVDLIITILAVFGGLELYGIGGALAALVITTFAHALASEIASTRPE